MAARKRGEERDKGERGKMKGEWIEKGKRKESMR